METATAHISRRCRPFVASAVSIILSSAIAAATPLGTRAAAEPHVAKRQQSYTRSDLVHPTLTKRIRIRYRAHNGARRPAYVLVPRSYRPGDGPIPLVISPHGRGVSGKANTQRWGNLPGIGGFAVVCPAGQGAKLAMYSWGAPGQISDLARMPQIVRAALPWLEIDSTRIYAFGGSMGGQETLLLAARHPSLLAGAAAIDSLVDFPRQYTNFPRLRCNERCLETWGEPLGIALQEYARKEVGGAPSQMRSRYLARSPLTHAAELASSCVPLQIWWSRTDHVVVDSSKQSGALFARLRGLSSHAPVSAYVGSWEHTKVFTPGRLLPFALAKFGLMPPVFDQTPREVRAMPEPAEACSRG